MPRDIDVTTLAVIEDGRFLLVRKRGSRVYILPGGKPEAGEDDAATLGREIGEELGCGIEGGSLHYVGTFSDAAADAPEGTLVHVKLYAGKLAAPPVPSAEIEELLWLEPGARTRPDLAPSLVRRILPSLLDSGGGWCLPDGKPARDEPLPASAPSM